MKKLKPIYIILPIVILAIIAAGYFVVGRYWGEGVNEFNTEEKDVVEEGEDYIVYDLPDKEGWQAFENDRWGLYFEFPEDWFFLACDDWDKEFDEDAKMIVLDDKKMRNCNTYDAIDGRIYFSLNNLKITEEDAFQKIKNKHEDTVSRDLTFDIGTEILKINDYDVLQTVYYYEKVGGEGERKKERPKKKIIENNIISDLKLISVSYLELFDVNKQIEGAESMLEKDYSNIYNQIMNSISF